MLGLAAAGCADDASKLNPVREPLRIVTGLPAAEQAPARIDRAPTDAAPGDFEAKRSTHCDSFGQPPAGKADVLWIVRRSPSMEAPVSRLAGVMEAFFGALASASPAPDFHLGFVASDLADDRVPGSLHAAAGGPAYLSCVPSGGVLRCNVGSGTVAEAIDWASRSLREFAAKDAPEKGLLAASRAISADLAAGPNAGFVRPDAQLRLVFFSNEDDASCFPYALPPGQDGCTSTGVCGCAAEPSFGDATYFSRLFDGAKGFGNAAFVSADAIVSTTAEPLDWQDGSGFPYAGCTADPGAPCAVAGQGGAFCALHAPRYAAVAAATGGRGFDPCEGDLGASLQEIGAAASGLLREFRLSRVPIEATIETVVVPIDPVSCNDASPCSDPTRTCVRDHCVTVVPQGPDGGWEHELCSGTDARNVIRFNGRSIPGRLQTAVVCYDVDVGSELSQCR